jgi:hypothetical protein
MAIKAKNKDIRTWQKSLRVASSKCLHRRRRASPVSTFVKHEMTSEADKDVLMASPKSGDYVYSSLHDVENFPGVLEADWPHVVSSGRLGPQWCSRWA